MNSFVCLFFDADGIVRATDTIVADDVKAASERAELLLSAMPAKYRLELWRDGTRVYRSEKK